jgi:hypothetical protein
MCFIVSEIVFTSKLGFESLPRRHFTEISFACSLLRQEVRFQQFFLNNMPRTLCSVSLWLSVSLFYGFSSIVNVHYSYITFLCIRNAREVGICEKGRKYFVSYSS